MPPTTDASTPASCPACHQPALSAYYFCPNCGTNLRPKPLPTDALSQALVYAHSIILPMICFITVSKWRGTAYYRSANPKERQVGAIAWILVVLSTVITCYLAYRWTLDTIRATQESINADLSF